MAKTLPSDRGDETFNVLIERMLDRQRAEDREYLDGQFGRLRDQAASHHRETMAALFKLTPQDGDLDRLLASIQAASARLP